jgi:hypothetical protein
VAIKVVIHSDYGNLRKVVVVGEVWGGHKEWHAEQNRALRSAEETLKWMKEQLGGKFMECMVDTIDKLACTESLDRAQFIIPGPDGDFGQPTWVLEEEDYFADLFGMGVFTVVFLRMRRCLFLWGWPHRMQSILVDKDPASIVEEFKKDDRLYQEYKAWPQKVKADKDILERHQMPLVPNRQLRVGFQQSSGVSDKLVALQEKRAETLKSSQIVEDVNNVQKNSRQVRGSNRFRKPLKSWGAAVRRHVTDKIHRWKPIPNTGGTVPKTTQLGKETFEVDRTKTSLPFYEKMVSTKQETPWWNPAVGELNAPVADLHMLRRAAGLGGRFAHVRNAWLGQLMHVTHKLIFTQKTPTQTILYFLAGYHFQGSSVLVWPMKVHEVPCYPQKQWVQAMVCTKPQLVPVFSLKAYGMSAATFTVTSWASQYYKYPQAIGHWSPAIRFMMNDKFKPIAEVAAENAWWQLPRTVVVDFLNYEGIAVEAGASLFKVLLTGVMGVLKMDRAAAMVHIHKRLARMPTTEDESINELLKIKEAVNCMDRMDHEKLVQEQEAVLKAQEARDDFALAYTREREAMPHRDTKRYPSQLPEVIPQSEAKRYAPQDTGIWRDNTKFRWRGHCLPYVRISEPWLVEGEPVALRALLRRLWRQANEKNGRAPTYCPIKGLFPSSAQGSS